MIWKPFRPFFVHYRFAYHPFQHFLVANTILFGGFLIWDSITIWEVVLFFFMTYMPILDEFIYALYNYLNKTVCRNLIHLFLAGEFAKFILWLHSWRYAFRRLPLHNFIILMTLWATLYTTFIFNAPLLFYGLLGVMTHLTLDMLNDFYEFGEVRKWFWPFLSAWS